MIWQTAPDSHIVFAPGRWQYRRTMAGKTSRLGPLYLLIAAGLWGGMYVVSAATLKVVPVWRLLEWRLLLGTPVLLAGVLRRPLPHAVTLRDVVLFGVLGAVGFTGSVGVETASKIMNKC